jgi:thymidylate synthase
MWVDKIFKSNLKLLMTQPWEDVKRPHYNDGENVKVKRLLQVCNQYDLRREFPISTIRPLNLKGCIKEVAWVWQKRSVDCDKLGLKIWDQWKDEDNRIPGCYGDMVDRYVVMSKTQDFNEWKPITLESLCSVFGNVDIIGNKVVGYGLLNQTDYILWCLKNDPSSRRIVASMFLPEMNALKPLEECAFQINLSVKGDELYMTLYQRSLDMVTPNTLEAAYIAGMDKVETLDEIKEAAARIQEMGAGYVVIKSGSRNNSDEAVDVLYDGKNYVVNTEKKIPGCFNHGAGCTFSAAITAGLAKGLSVKDALAEAKEFITVALKNSFRLNQFSGATDHCKWKK